MGRRAINKTETHFGRAGHKNIRNVQEEREVVKDGQHEDSVGKQGTEEIKAGTVVVSGAEEVTVPRVVWILAKRNQSFKVQTPLILPGQRPKLIQIPISCSETYASGGGEQQTQEGPERPKGQV